MKRIVFTLLAATCFGGLAFAEAMKKHPEPTKEQRVKMAEMHEKLAACLRSDKPAHECHNEMMDSCRESKDACPMMGMMHPGMMHHHEESEKAEKKE